MEETKVKKVISLLFVLLLVLTMVAGCGKNKETIEASDDTSSGATADETVENTTNDNESKDSNSDEPRNTATADNTDTGLFGIPQKTDEYNIKDLSDPQNEYFLNHYKDRVIGMGGFILIGDDLKEGEYYPEGGSLFYWAKPDSAVVIKEIAYLDEIYHITLEEVEKGTPQSHEMLYITCKKQFKDLSVKYTDGTGSQNITELDKEFGLERVSGEFQKVDPDENTIEIIPSTASIPYTYTLVNVAPESLEGLQKGDKIEYMHGNYKDTVHAVVKMEGQNLE